MDSELTNITAVKALDQGVATTDSPNFAALNVNGTVTADGLTVDVNSGSAEFIDLGQTASDAPQILIGNGDTSARSGLIRNYNDASNFEIIASASVTADKNLVFRTVDNASESRLKIANNGDISFYEDTGTTAKLFWDSSAESLGIGSSSPAAALDISQANARGAYLRSSTTGSRLHFLDATTASVTTVGIGAEGNNLVLHGGGTEVIRVASSGSVGVGTNDPAQKLHVSSSSAVVGLLESTGSSAARLYFDNTGMSTAGDAQIWSQNNDLILNASGAERLRVSSTGIDVTGTIVGDGLTVENDNESMSTFYRPNSSEAAAFNINFDFNTANGTQETFAQLRVDNDGNINGSQDGALSIRTAKSGSLLTRFKADENGDISFYESTGTTPKFFWDSSAESLGIGTSSPSEIFEVSTATANTAYLKVGTTNNGSSNVVDSDIAGLEFYSGDTSGAGAGVKGSIRYKYGSSSGATTHMTFHTANVSGSNDVERMRIDSSGNLLVGTTDTFPGDGDTNTGISLAASGSAAFSRDGFRVVSVNRNTSDGTLIEFNKGGVEVGSVGTIGGDMYVGTGDTGIRFDDATNHIRPCGVSGANLDATIDIGDSSRRFKDLYLSGGVHLGGTGSANKLDDYEEGTFTPTIAGSTSGDITGFTISGANYTKVGRVVSLNCYLSAVDISTSTISGEVRIQSLPFTSANFTGVIVVTYCNWFTLDESDITVSGYTQGNELRLLKGSSTSPLSSSDLNTGATNGVIMLKVVYITS
jgi:hypothetical protein